MVGNAPNGNPFRPGAGEMPPVLAGREEDLELAERKLQELTKRRRPAQGILFFGPRGNGKTVLLRQIGERAAELGLRAELLPSSVFRREARLVREMQRRARVAVGPTVEHAASSDDHFELFTQWVHADAAPLVVLLDEVHTLAADPARDFFEAAQNAASEGAPFVLIAAGTPDAPRALRRAGTFTERMLERRRIGRLERDAAATAIATPAEQAGCPMDAAALELLVRESQNYPYFIQVLGSTAWDAAAHSGTGRIGREAAEQGVTAAAARIEAFFQERFAETRDRRMHKVLQPLAERMAVREGQIEDADLDDLLDRVAAGRGGLDDPGAIRIALQDLGVIWEASSGVWEMGIPSFAEHVLRRSDSRPDGIAAG